MIRAAWKSAKTLGEPDAFFKEAGPFVNTSKPERPPLQDGQSFVEHPLVLRLVGVLLWVSLRAQT